MKNEFSKLPQQEQMEAENMFLAMKLMAEFGGHVEIPDNADDTSVEITNAFLKKTLEYEQHLAAVTHLPLGQVYDIENMFPPLYKLKPEDVETNWRQLEDFLRKKGIKIRTISPHIKMEDLYQFARTELIHEVVPSEMIPGFILNFIYDDFHPDRQHNACLRAQQDIIVPFFNNPNLVPMGFIPEKGVWMNEHHLISEDEYQQKVAAFHQQFTMLQLHTSHISDCAIVDNLATVHGRFDCLILETTKPSYIQGNWEINLYEEEKDGWWFLEKLRIDLNI